MGSSIAPMSRCCAPRLIVRFREVGQLRLPYPVEFQDLPADFAPQPIGRLVPVVLDFDFEEKVGPDHPPSILRKWSAPFVKPAVRAVSVRACAGRFAPCVAAKNAKPRWIARSIANSCARGAGIRNRAGNPPWLRVLRRNTGSKSPRARPDRNGADGGFDKWRTPFP